jgi:TonB family protein
MPEPAQLVPPRVITSAGTAYPVEAFRLTVRRQELGSSLAIEGAEGTVRVRALVRADGTSDSVEVAASSGSAILDRAATEAVRRWLFAPATRNGVPLDAYVTVTIRYVVR